MKPYLLLDNEVFLDVVKTRLQKILVCKLTRSELLKLLNNFKVNINQVEPSISDTTVRALKSLYFDRGLNIPKDSNAGYNSNSLNHFWISKNDLIKVEKELNSSSPLADEQEKSINEQWKLTEDEYLTRKAHQLIPQVMRSLGIDPMAYPIQHNRTGLKKKIHEQGKVLYKKKFLMNFKSFSVGNKSPWQVAKRKKLIKEEK